MRTTTLPSKSDNFIVSPPKVSISKSMALPVSLVARGWILTGVGAGSAVLVGAGFTVAVGTGVGEGVAVGTGVGSGAGVEVGTAVAVGGGDADCPQATFARATATIMIGIARDFILRL